MAEHDLRALELFEQGKNYNEIADILGIGWKQVNHALTRARKAKKIEYEDKKEYSEQDMEEYIASFLTMQRNLQRLDTKQVKATFRINDDKPVGVAYWGDWHIGASGTDYERFESDLQNIKETDGLYFIGAGDYKDNYITGTHAGGNFEQIIQPGMQDRIVQHYMGKVAEKCIALVRGCHDDWDKKGGDRDFLETLCEITDSINLWHGGELNIKLGEQEYFWRCRHKYKYQSSLNLENAMRRIMEIQGPCDVAAEAHLHNGYVMTRHIMGSYRVLLRSGSYKTFDEYGQKLAGYKGKPSVPVVIMYPDRHAMTTELFLHDAVEVLGALRNAR